MIQRESFGVHFLSLTHQNNIHESVGAVVLTFGLNLGSVEKKQIGADIRLTTENTVTST